MTQTKKLKLLLFHVWVNICVLCSFCYVLKMITFANDLSRAVTIQSALRDTSRHLDKIYKKHEGM